MSNSPESKNSITNPGAMSSQAAGTPAPNPAATPATSATNPASTTPAQFKTENIGNWAAHQEGYFAEQNRKAEEKRKKSEQTRKKVLPIIFIVGGLIAAALIIWGIVALVIALASQPESDVPTIAGGTSEDVNNYRDVLQDFFSRNGDDISSVEDAVNEALETDNGKEYADQIRLAELIVLQNNGYYAEAIEKAKAIDVDKLTLDQKISYYSILYYCSTMLGDSQAANEYFRIQYELSLEQGGEGGGA